MYISTSNILLTQVDVPLVEINIGFLADQVGVPTANTLDLSQGVHDFALPINIGVEETENVLQFVRKSVSQDDFNIQN